MTLKEAMNSVKQRQIDAACHATNQKRIAINALQDIICLLENCFEDLKGWDQPAYAGGAAYSTYWLPCGVRGKVYFHVDSRHPEEVAVCRNRDEVSVTVNPFTCEGLDFLMLAVAERLLCYSDSEITTLR